MEVLSIIVPCYNEEESLPIFYKEIEKLKNSFKAKKVTLELLFIDDGSKDKTLSIIKSYAKKDKDVRFISFSRNFGQEAGIYAGLDNCTGDLATIMDVDLQDPPELLLEMYDAIHNEGYDIVAARRTSREGEGAIRNFLTHGFYKLIAKMSKTEMVEGARNYRLMTRQVVNSVLSMKEYSRYSKGLLSFVGFKTKWLGYQNRERVAGTSKWGLRKLFKYAFDGIIAFSTAPLGIAFFLGNIMTAISLIAFIVILIQALCHVFISQFTILMFFILLMSGLIITFIGILGGYLAKIYLEVLKRPLYIIKETEKNIN